jgi:hypothetical protein
MSIRLAILAATAASGIFLAAPAVPAEAGGLRLNLYPPFVHYRAEPRYYYYEPDPYEDDEDFYAYEDDDWDTAPPGYDEPPIKRRVKPRTVYEDPYDQPEYNYEPPIKKKTKKKPPVEAKTAPVKKKPSQEASVAPDAVPAAKPAKPSQGAGKVSCDKAKAIVGGYGFSNVESKACDGSVYRFSAKRDGKAFDVKVSSLSGELTEVKRQ